MNLTSNLAGKRTHLPLQASISRVEIGAWLLAMSLLVFVISDTFLSLNIDSSSTIKLFAFSLVGGAIALRPRFHRMIVLAAPMGMLLAVSLGRSYDEAAGFEELLRFLCPLMLTMGLFAYRDHLSPVLRIFFLIVITNDLYQLWAYLAFVTGLPQFLIVRFDSGLFLRAQGWIGFFSQFAFFNFCAFVLCRRLRPTKQSLRWSWVFLTFSLLAFSFKLLPAVALFPFTARRLRWQGWLSLGAILVGLLIAIMSGYLDSLIGVAAQKIGFYITDGNSARADSYRVMGESLAKWNMLGEGLGSFGGPASVKYHSPLYGLYHFNWYGLGDGLKTTDTFYPHLFVELGLIGGILWMWMVLRYGNRNPPNRTWLLIVLTFCFDNAFSSAFVSPSYVFAALLVMYLFRKEGTVRA